MGKGFLISALALGLVLQVPSVQAAEESQGATAQEEAAAKAADDWFTVPKEGSVLEAYRRQSAARANASAKETQEEQEKNYPYLLTDNGFSYYLDKRTAHWIPMPHSGSEYIADVWVRLVPEGGSLKYSEGEKYYLEHYYIRPAKRQIQFLSELEVTGRPDNAIEERTYSVQNWENLVPGSIEEEIYTAVLKKMGKNKLGGSSSGGMSVRDMVDEYLRISL